MPTLQRRQLVGHDILLARHGNHISTMRVDRQSGRVFAYLDDGSVDSAPNMISPGLRMPDTVRSIFREGPVGRGLGKGLWWRLRLSR